MIINIEGSSSLTEDDLEELVNTFRNAKERRIVLIINVTIRKYILDSYFIFDLQEKRVPSFFPIYLKMPQFFPNFCENDAIFFPIPDRVLFPKYPRKALSDDVENMNKYAVRNLLVGYIFPPW